MSHLSERLLDHLERLSGKRPALVPEAAARLPLFLRTRFTIRSVHVFGRRFLLAMEAEGGDPATPGDYGAHTRTLEGLLAEPIVLVLPRLPSYARDRLVRLGIPFIVPGSQVFLPTALMDLRERQPRVAHARGRLLTPAAQCLVLYHLQRGSLAERPLRDVAGKIGYSPIMLTNVKVELVSAGICEAVRARRATRLRFPREGRDLWEFALPLLSRPDRRELWIQWKQPGYPALLAGMSALGRRSMIEPDPRPTYALWHKSIPPHLEDALFRKAPGREEADIRLEAWNYDPRTLGDEEMVDPLSLYLSLRDSPDERIQQQLQKLIEEVSW